MTLLTPCTDADMASDIITAFRSHIRHCTKSAVNQIDKMEQKVTSDMYINITTYTHTHTHTHLLKTVKVPHYNIQGGTAASRRGELQEYSIPFDAWLPSQSPSSMIKPHDNSRWLKQCLLNGRET